MTEHLDPSHLRRQAFDQRQLAEQDARHLAQVAVGLGSQLSEDAVERLIEAGFVQRAPHRLPGAPELELTPSGLARIRSSDQ